MSIYTAAQYLAAAAAGTAPSNAVVLDSAANIQASLDVLQPFAATGDIAYVDFTDSGSPRIYVTYAQNAADAAVIGRFQGQRTTEVSGVTVAEAYAIHGQQHIALDIADTGSVIKANIDSLDDISDVITSITITDGSIPTFSLSQAVGDTGTIGRITIAGISAEHAAGNLSAVAGMHGFAVSDSAANVVAQLDGLETLDVAAKLSSITLTDAGVATLAMSPVTMLRDAGAIETIQSPFLLAIDGSTANLDLTAPKGADAELILQGSPSQYSVSLSSDGTTLVVTDIATGRSSTDHLTGFTALAFDNNGAGQSLTLVASTTPVAGASVSSAQVAALYAAVLDRTPDAAGLAFYENQLAADPSVALTQLAKQFLVSPEYTSNSAHTYAQTVAGETQFITDSYANLLNRAPEAGAVDFYLTSVIDPLLAGLTLGTAAYAAADLAAHALFLSYVSLSPEFRTDVSVTALTPASASHWLILG